MRKIVSLLLCFMISFSAVGADCDAHFEREKLSPSEKYVKKKVGKFTKRFKTGFLHTRSIFKYPAKIKTQYLLTLRRLMQRFLTKTKKPAYFLMNDEASYLQILKYVDSYKAKLPTDVADDFSENLIKASKKNLENTDLDLPDIGKFDTPDVLNNVDDSVVESVDNWITQYANYNKNLDDLYEEMAYRYHAIEELSKLQKRVKKDDTPFKVTYVTKDKYKGVVENTILSNDEDMIKAIIAEELGELRKIKGNLFKAGELQDLRNQQATIRVRLVYLKKELTNLFIHIDDKLKPPGLEKKIQEINKLLKDEALTPDAIATLKLATKEYKAEWEQLSLTKSQFDEKVKKYVDETIGQMSEREKQFLKLDKTRRFARVWKIGERAALPFKYLEGAAGLTAGFWVVWRAMQSNKDLRYECITGASSSGDFNDPNIPMPIPTDPTVPGGNIPGGVPPGYGIPVESYGMGIGDMLYIPGDPNSGLPPGSGGPGGLGGYYYSNAEFLQCIIQRYIPSKYPKKYIKMLENNDYRPFDPDKINKASKEDQKFMRDWNEIFVARKKHLEQIIADQKFDNDMYEQGTKKIEEHGLDSLETQIMQNPMYGGGVVIDPTIPGNIPVDPTVPGPTPIGGNPNIPGEGANGGYYYNPYVGNGRLHYDPENAKANGKNLIDLYGQDYEKAK